MKTMMNRKTATKLLLVQWSRFQNVSMRLEGSTLFTGVNTSGKSTILDAMTYLLTGNTQFNKAAKDRDRTVVAYVRGDTKSNGPERYLRTGEVVSYIVMEFWSPVEEADLVVGVCIESADETSYRSSWFVCRDTQISQMNFTRTENGFLYITPRNELSVDGKPLRSADFMGRDRGVEQVLRALGLRCDVTKYRSKLLKMMAFNPENNIDQFIQECVLETGKVESLKELREQKDQFEHIKEIYENLRNSKKQLELTEKISEEYENRLRALKIRRMMFAYQKVREKEEEKNFLERELESLAHKREQLQEQKKDLEQRYDAASERLRIAESNDTFRGMQDSIRNMESQCKDLADEIRKYEEKLADLKKLQAAMISLLRWIEEYFPVEEEDKKYLFHLSERGFQEDKKTDAFLRLAKAAGNQDRIFQTEEVHLNDRKKELDDELVQLEKNIKKLKSNLMVFPKEVEEGKRIIREELEKQGIHTQVRVFAELVQEVKDPSWRAAIETFLGWKRFHIVVDGEYCHKAMEILQNKSLHQVKVVITDKLPETDIQPGSAAEVLTVPNVFARRYANYLLNGIHLCSTLEELHEYPKGGLMKNGMLAKSYAVSNMDTQKTEFCLGEDAVRLQLERALEKKKEKEEERGHICREKDEIGRKRQEIQKVDWNLERYDFQAEAHLENGEDSRSQLLKQIDEIKNSPDFLAVLQEQQAARKAYRELKTARDQIISQIGACGENETLKKQALETASGELYTLNQEYEQRCEENLELKQPMMEEYEKLREKNGTWQVITRKAIQNMEYNLNDCVHRLENAQIDYCKLAEKDINKRGTAYIPFYREEYRNIANVKIEEAHQKLEEQAEKLESAFMNDFVAEINESVREAKREIDMINRELKQLPFGNDTYRFVMEEKADRAVFFRICKKLESYMDSGEAYMSMGRDDEEMERDIQEFMAIILNEEDEEEYTDYRKYFTYDMKIISRQGDREVIADLSKKQGSASNGEKQTPYFIILAASLTQCYPKNTCCARLAFIDEAFSALSRERIEQMVKYFEENHFQVFYAAPPEKISSIGAFIESTVSLVITGRYTNAIEGLVKNEDRYVG